MSLRLSSLALLLAACGTTASPADGGADASVATAEGGAIDGSPPTDARDSSTPHDAGVPCGSQVCSAGSVCCALDAGAAGTAVTCVGGTSSCPGVPVECDGPEDCGGSPCCANGDVGSTCLRGGGACGETLCHAEKDCGGTGWQCCPPRPRARLTCVAAGGACMR